MKTHRNSAMGRSRDFGTEGAGKGDADRVTDGSAYRTNYEGIDWGKKGDDKSVINPAWVAAGPEANIVFLNFKPLDIGPNPTLEDFENWDR